ncbi:MAG: flavin reductase family protein [Anaerobutyricum sp.]|nr:flavin reductase family protein [Eubacterium sp.]MDY6046663.1 flavin reductase family protein [Anaerobutyricum sp.]
MGKIDFKPGNMLYPLPAVLVTVRDKEGRDNMITIAWAGTACTNPPMLYISVRPERYSYKALRETGEFVVNLTTKDMAKAVDYCGVRSGKDVDKFKQTGLQKGEASKVNVSVIEDSPVNIECKVRELLELGSHHMFLADVVHVTVDDRYMDEKGTFHLERANPIVYSHGTYFDIGNSLGTFGYSVRKKKRKRK